MCCVPSAGQEFCWREQHVLGVKEGAARDSCQEEEEEKDEDQRGWTGGGPLKPGGEQRFEIDTSFDLRALVIDDQMKIETLKHCLCQERKKKQKKPTEIRQQREAAEEREESESPALNANAAQSHTSTRAMSCHLLAPALTKIRRRYEVKKTTNVFFST